MNTIQDYINELISTPSAFMLNASMFSKDIPQLAHHSLYIKNVLYKAFSMPHSLTFDFHTMVLSQGMVKKSSKEIAHLFMEHFSVLGLMSRLQKTFELSSSSEGLYTAFSSVIHSDISKEVVWQVSEEDFSVRLTPMGALFVLIGLGFVKLA